MATETVRFTKTYIGFGGVRYNAGEEASFSEKQARALVSLGHAKPLKQRSVSSVPSGSEGQDQVPDPSDHTEPDPTDSDVVDKNVTDSPENKMVGEHTVARRQKGRPRLG